MGHHWPAGETFRWGVDGGPTLNAGLYKLCGINRGSGPILLKKPYIIVIFHGGGGGGSRPPVPPLNPRMPIFFNLFVCCSGLC